MNIILISLVLLQVVSDTAQQVIDTIVNTGLGVHTATGGGQLINGVDNGVTASILSVIIGAIWRAIEKRRLEKRLKKKFEAEGK